jgi:hypothetical protein
MGRIGRIDSNLKAAAPTQQWRFGLATRGASQRRAELRLAFRSGAARATIG